MINSISNKMSWLSTLVFASLLVALAFYLVTSTPVAKDSASHSKLKSHLKTKLRDNTKMQAQGIQRFSGQEYQQCILRCQETFRQCSLGCGVDNNPCLAEVRPYKDYKLLIWIIYWFESLTKTSTEVLLCSTRSATAPPCVARTNVTVSPTIREHEPVLLVRLPLRTTSNDVDMWRVGKGNGEGERGSGALAGEGRN